MSPNELNVIKARADAAAPAPWRADGMEITNTYSDQRVPGTNRAVEESLRIYDEGGHGPEDAEFIAHARTDVPALIAARLRGYEIPCQI